MSAVTAKSDLPKHWTAAQKNFFLKLYGTARRYPAALVKKEMMDLPITPAEWNALCHNFAWLAVEAGRGTQRIDFVDDDPVYDGGWVEIYA